MRVLIDTNVALTTVSGREDPFSNEVESIIRLCAEEKIDGAIAFHSLSTIWYQTRKLPVDTRRDWIRQLCQLLTITSADNDSVLKAVDDVEDFIGVSNIPALTPKEFLELG